MVSVHVLVRVLIANLCKEVTGGLFHFILFCILIICMKCIIFSVEEGAKKKVCVNYITSIHPSRFYVEVRVLACV